MRIKEGFVLRNIVDEWIIIPFGEHALSFSGTIILNDTGAYLWRQMIEDTSEEVLINKMVNEYNITKEQACDDFSRFIKQLDEAGVITQGDTII